MHFEWDSEKARKNAIKHGISFKAATFAFDDTDAFIMDDLEHSGSEPRQWLIGDSEKGILVVVFTIPRHRQSIRIISARKANRNERRAYGENKGI